MNASLASTVQLLVVIIIISLFCNGLYVITRPGMLFEFAERWLYQLVFPAKSENIRGWHTQLYKPLLGCIKCMASVWGIFICLLLLPHNYSLFYQVPVVCICASALNAVVYQFYEG